MKTCSVIESTMAVKEFINRILSSIKFCHIDKTHCEFSVENIQKEIWVEVVNLECLMQKSNLKTVEKLSVEE